MAALGSVMSNAACAVVVLLLGASLLWLPRAYLRAWRLWSAERDGFRWVVGGAVVGGAALRLLVAPLWIATVYIGYLLTEQALDLAGGSHYGVGSQALYHALFAFLPHDHRSLMWVNSVVGVLTLPLTATVALRWLGDRRAASIAAVLVAVVPLFIRNDNSDANNVPCLWWLLGGLVLWEEYLAEGRRLPMIGALGLLALATAARPEMLLLAPLLVALATAGLESRGRVARDRALWGALAAAAVLLVPHALHVALAVDTLGERGSLPGLSLSRFVDLPAAMVTMNAVLRPALYPVALTALAALALARPDAGSRRARLALALMAAVACAAYQVDLCRANLARVHVPAALFATILAADGLAWVWARFRSTRVLLCAAVAGAAIPTALVLWRPTNEQTEERFLRRALGELPTSRHTLIRQGRVDRGGDAGSAASTHDHFPDYLVRPPVGRATMATVRDWVDHPDYGAPAFFYQGMRCYAAFQAGAGRPRGDNLQPACARMRRDFRLDPVLEEEVVNHGNVWLDYYGDAPTLRLGLYRVLPRPPGPGEGRPP
ncbi:MAG: glycosyltransferase family 39 protein [Deltaproteobacteria bacterium]|nr:glycosyltransferase family 39 protein [Deltaproteobacteria bacterium]